MGNVNVEKFVNTQATTIITDCDCDAQGPFPLSGFTALGLAIVQSTTAAQVRALIAAAASGANSDIVNILGLTTPLPITEGGTGANNPTQARLNLGIFTSLSGLPVRRLTANYVATSVDAVFLCDTSGGAFTLTIPNALSNAGATQVFIVLKTNGDAIPLTIQDDSMVPNVLGAILAESGFAIVVCSLSSSAAGLVT